jgi:hypothetical protein
VIGVINLENIREYIQIENAIQNQEKVLANAEEVEEER